MHTIISSSSSYYGKSSYIEGKCRPRITAWNLAAFQFQTWIKYSCLNKFYLRQISVFIWSQKSVVIQSKIPTAMAWYQLHVKKQKLFEFFIITWEDFHPKFEDTTWWRQQQWLFKVVSRLCLPHVELDFTYFQKMKSLTQILSSLIWIFG